MSVLRPSLCHLRVKDLTQVPYPTRTQLKFELVGFYAESNAVIQGAILPKRIVEMTDPVAMQIWNCCNYMPFSSVQR